MKVKRFALRAALEFLDGVMMGQYRQFYCEGGVFPWPDSPPFTGVRAASHTITQKKDGAIIVDVDLVPEGEESICRAKVRLNPTATDFGSFRIRAKLYWPGPGFCTQRFSTQTYETERYRGKGHRSDSGEAVIEKIR
jgi:hypothetical protein